MELDNFTIKSKINSNLLQELTEQHFIIIDNFISEKYLSSTLEEIYDLLNSDKFYPAQIGKNLNLQLDQQIRNSLICWIEDWKKNRVLEYIYFELTKIQNTLNEHFLLSLKRFESQFAIYPDGGFYKKHVDQFKQQKHRQVSAIIYLNDNFEGGELVLYSKDDKNKIEKTIVPKKGQLVLFFSKTIYHEVLKCSGERISLTTWFRDDHLL